MSPARGPTRPCVFLDRDGTLNEEVHFLRKVEDLRLLPGVPAALAALRAAGYACVVVTNQSGIARGLLDEDDLARIHAELEARLTAEGARLDGIYYSPYHPTAGSERWRKDSDCRKPGPGMLLRAQRELDLDLGSSWIVGDAGRDLEAGERAGVAGILVATGKGAAEHARLTEAGIEHRFVPDLPAAAKLILDSPQRGGRGRAPQGK